MPYTKTLVDFAAKPDWLLEVNPAGSVPVMKVRVAGVNCQVVLALQLAGWQAGWLDGLVACFAGFMQLSSALDALSPAVGAAAPWVSKAVPTSRPLASPPARPPTITAGPSQRGVDCGQRCDLRLFGEDLPRAAPGHGGQFTTDVSAFHWPEWGCVCMGQGGPGEAMGCPTCSQPS